MPAACAAHIFGRRGKKRSGLSFGTWFTSPKMGHIRDPKDSLGVIPHFLGGFLVFVSLVCRRWVGWSSFSKLSFLVLVFLFSHFFMRGWK